MIGGVAAAAAGYALGRKLAWRLKLAARLEVEDLAGHVRGRVDAAHEGAHPASVIRSTISVNSCRAAY